MAKFKALDQYILVVITGEYVYPLHHGKVYEENSIGIMKFVVADHKANLTFFCLITTRQESCGSGGYKVRMAIASKGKGKSGGSRVITCVKIVEEHVYLLSIYDKSDKESISDKELDELLKLAGL